MADRETIPFVPHDKFLRNVIVAAEPIKTEFFWLSSLFNYLLGNVQAPEVASGAITLLFKLKWSRLLKLDQIKS